MHSTRVKPKLVNTTRLDPDYYHPQHIEDELVMRNFGADFLGSAGKLFAGPFGSKLPSNLYLKEGIPLFRVGNVGSMEVEMSGMAHLAPEVHAELSSSEVRSGDLLLVKASVGEKICKVPESMPQANITQHIIALRSNGNSDTDYLTAYLFGSYGRRQLIRRSLGSVIQYLGVNDARTVLTPKLDKKAQAYIGEKVRQAERLRINATHLSSKIRNNFLYYFGDFTPTTFSKSYRVASKTISNRADAWFYNPHFIHAQKQVLSNGIKLTPLNEIASLITNGATPSGAKFNDTGIPWIRGQNFTEGDIEFEKLPLMDFESESTIKRSRLETGDLILSIKGTVGDVVVIDEKLAGSNINQDIAKLKFSSVEIASFLAYFLESELGQILIQQQLYGAINQFFSLENLRRFPVPNPNSVQDSFKSEIANGRMLAIKLRRFSKNLVAAAKYLVEGLIEGKITENELVAAEEALQAGERELDTAILARLTRKGMDAPHEAALFADLDALYAVLDETNSVSISA